MTLAAVTVALITLLKGLKMTQREFYDLCTSMSIYPLYALENENLKQALRERDDEKVKEILENEF